jgi:hypothetical protein
LAADTTREDNDNDKMPAWRTPLPFLWLYCCLTLDEVKVEMANQFCVMDREQLSAHNSDLRPPTYFQILADKFNDPLIVFVTEQLPELHQDFAEPINLKFKDMPGKATAEQMKKKVAGCQALLAQVHTLDIGHFGLTIIALHLIIELLSFSGFSLLGEEWEWCWTMT